MPLSPAAPALFPVWLGFAAAILTSGCEKRLSDENIDVANKFQESAKQRKRKWTGVNEGMTEKEVESILGQPTVKKEGRPMLINQPVEVPTVTYVYQQDGKTIELSFLDGKLQERIPKFGETLDSEAPLHMKKNAAGEPPKTETPASPSQPPTQPK